MTGVQTCALPISSAVINDIISLCDQVDFYPLKKQEKQQLAIYLNQKSPKTFSEGLEHLRSYNQNIRGNEPTHYYSALYNVMNNDTVADTIYEIGENLSGLKQHYAKSDDDIFYKDPPFLYLVDYAEKYGTDFYGFIDHVESVIAKMVNYPVNNEEEIDLDIRKKVHLMTALRAKGKEFETVIILDVNDGIWPIKFAIEEYQLEQERRLFYVAMTRAKKRLIFITVKEMIGKKMAVSPYLKEIGLI